MNLFIKTETGSQKTNMVGSEKFMVTSGERLVWGINWEFGIDMYTSLY